MRTIHIIPGRIERGSAPYDDVVDQGSDYMEPAITEPATLSKAETSIPNHGPIRLGKLEIKALATESSEYGRLLFNYKVLLPNGSITHISPEMQADFGNSMLRRDERVGGRSNHTRSSVSQLEPRALPLVLQ
ncbi:MAG: hypothetical protein Q9208_005338 [Pyrenodesmia sp. 3 TL-2023]